MIRLPCQLLAMTALYATTALMMASASGLPCDAFSHPSTLSALSMGTSKELVSSATHVCQSTPFQLGKKLTSGCGRMNNSRLFLFDSLLQPKKPRGGLSDRINEAQKVQRLKSNRIPENELEKLSNGYGIDILSSGDQNYITPPFPYTIDLLPPKNNNNNNGNNGDIPQVLASKLAIRHLEEEDIKKVLPEIVREFGSLMSPSSNGKNNAPKQPGDELATQIENFLFSFTVLLGLDQRVERRKKGYSDDASINNSNLIPDHNVICLVEQIPIITTDGDGSSLVTYTEQIVGIGELSWQPPIPTRNAPPFVLPYFVKSILSRLSPAPALDNNNYNGDASSSSDMITSPRGYISNVLVYKSRRGLGYGRVLMAALEGMARLWKCDDVRLHVDANEISGNVAQRLYWGLGYEGVPDRGGGGKGGGAGFEWMGPGMANRGLYLVDGLPLLYLCKNLKGK